MPIQIYNSLTKRKEPFEPLNPPGVAMYSCGVTVYDDCHLGHARSLYTFDVIRRYLRYRGYDVKFVRNITDIDDKIINRAKELKCDWKGLAEKYIGRHYEDLRALDIDVADVEPRATENIPDMVNHIKGLIDKGYAYVTESGVYFSVRKFKDYGKLSGQGIEQMLTGVRKEPDEAKVDPLDFALWKSSKPKEPSWDSPWGGGRPGWHIECSVMSAKYLKTETLDIHSGGRDLIFPHHENEIAQSEALSGRQFVRYWIHHGLLTINEQKMSKSLGNFVRIKDFLQKYNNSDILKLFFLSVHYSHPIDYNDLKIEEARKQKRSFDDFFDKVNSWFLLEGKVSQPAGESDRRKIEDICDRFQGSMDDDFNTPCALACLFELIDLGSRFISSDKNEMFDYARSRLEEFFNIFGLKVKPKSELPPEFKKLVCERDLARKNKDFKKADRIREEIKNRFQGAVIDTAGGVTFTKL